MLLQFLMSEFVLAWGQQDADSKKCIFPFKYAVDEKDEETYTAECAKTEDYKDKNGDKIPWCATSVNDEGYAYYWKDCQDNRKTQAKVKCNAIGFPEFFNSCAECGQKSVCNWDCQEGAAGQCEFDPNNNCDVDENGANCSPRKKCVFPFNYTVDGKEETYMQCAKTEDYNYIPWCATSLHDDETRKVDDWSECQDNSKTQAKVWCGKANHIFVESCAGCATGTGHPHCGGDCEFTDNQCVFKPEQTHPEKSLM